MDFKEFERQMAYHAATPEGRAALKTIREKITDIGKFLTETIPPSAERTLALRSLHEARMKCNAALMLSGPSMGVPE